MYHASPILKGVSSMPMFLFALPALLLQEDESSPLGTIAGVFFLTCVFALVVTVVAGMWKTFTKAGQPGWGVLIPIYNAYLLTQIAKKPGWWVLLLFIPIVNLIVNAIVSVGVAENFGKGAGFGIGLFFLPFIFYPVLGFGEATYASRSRF
jgi:Family of unknown function (DUF5684)